jgi:ribosomal protein S6--L-glutamate ligase
MNITSHKPPSATTRASRSRASTRSSRASAPRITFYGTAVVRQFEMMGVYPLNESVAITRSRDKLRSRCSCCPAGVSGCR